MAPVDGLCLAGGGGLAQQVLVPAHSARPIGFSVVPMAAAAVSLKVVARGSLEFPVGDAVSKILKIEVNGAPLKPDLQAPRFTPRLPAPTLLARPKAHYPNQLLGQFAFCKSHPTLPPKFESKSGECTGVRGRGVSAGEAPAARL